MKLDLIDMCIIVVIAIIGLAISSYNDTSGAYITGVAACALTTNIIVMKYLYVIHNQIAE